MSKPAHFQRIAAAAVAIVSLLACTTSIWAQAAAGARARTNRQNGYFADRMSGAPVEADLTDAAVPNSAAYVAAQSASADRFERDTLQRLDQTIAVNAVTTPLRDVMQQIAGQVGTPIVLDEKSLMEANIQSTTDITAARSRGSARAILKSILEPIDCDWVIADGAIVVTTAAKQKEAVTARVYPVYDLVAARDAAGNVGYDFDGIIDVITSTIAPSTWTDAGGMGSIAPFEPSCGLVVSQTREVHEKIDGLLAALRTTRRLQRLPAVRTIVFPQSDAVATAFADESWTETETVEQPRQTIRRNGAMSTTPAWRIPHDSEGRPMATAGAAAQAGGGAF